MTVAQLSSDLFLYLVTFRRQVRHGINPEPDQVRAQLTEIFGEQDSQARQDPQLDRLYQQAKYALVVLADEILIKSRWAYADSWEEQLLEFEYFQTRLAGEEFFSRLASEGERNEDLAEIYYIALCLGFTGIYDDDPVKIQDLKARLYRLLPKRLSSQEVRITPDAYHIAEGPKKPFKPMVNLGRVAIVCGALVVGLMVSYYMGLKTLRGNVIEQVVDMRAKAEDE